MAKARAEVQTGAKRKVRPWTVMVYMAAGDSAEMDDYAVRDLREMEQGVNEHAWVVVQIKRQWPTTPQKYVISRDPNSANGDKPAKVDSVGHSKHTDMGARETLAEFLKWSVRHYPAERYMLVLWGHAYGLGFGRDHGDPLKLSELAGALDDFMTERGKQRGVESRLEILGTNACAMSYVEAAHQLRCGAQYMLASQISVPFAGWPYDAVLQSISAKTWPEQLGRSVIDAYITDLNLPLTGERVQMSLLKLPEDDSLQVATDNFADSIKAMFKSDGFFNSRTRAAVRDAFIGAAAGDVRPLVDVNDLCGALRPDLIDPEVPRALVTDGQTDRIAKKGRKDLRKNLQKSISAMQSLVDPHSDKRLVLVSKAHPDMADLAGLGIYVPFVTDDQDLKRLGLDDDPFKSRRGVESETSKETYQKLAIFSDRKGGTPGNWPALVYDDLNDPLPSELVDLIAAIGVTNSTDRAEIAQIVLSIESAFNKLDRLLDHAQEDVMNKLRDKQRRGRARPLPGHLVLQDSATDGNGDAKEASRREPLDPDFLLWFQKLESAVAAVESTARRGLTEARFGLGPVTSPRGFDSDDPKPGSGPGPREEQLNVRQRTRGLGATNGETVLASPLPGDLDPDVLPVFALFSKAAEALKELESATAKLEDAAGRSLGKAVLTKRALKMRQAFGILRERATSARRIIRKVVANPAYGLGPTPAAFDRDERDELANAAGLSARNLLLLGVGLLAPDPKWKELIGIKRY
jgi:hypothetical protein